MQIEKPCCRKLGVIEGLGIGWESLVPVAGSLLTGGKTGSAGAAGGQGPITVSPQISTQISPQISPVFQQQFQPSGSPISAGTSQTLPAMPSMGPDGGYSGAPLPAGYAPPQPAIPMPAAPAQNRLAKYLPWVLGASALAVIVAVIVKRKKAVK
jgi:hypothetical protein